MDSVGSLVITSWSARDIVDPELVPLSNVV